MEKSKTERINEIQNLITETVSKITELEYEGIHLSRFLLSQERGRDYMIEKFNEMYQPGKTPPTTQMVNLMNSNIASRHTKISEADTRIEENDKKIKESKERLEELKTLLAEIEDGK